MRQKRRTYLVDNRRFCIAPGIGISLPAPARPVMLRGTLMTLSKSSLIRICLGILSATILVVLIMDIESMRSWVPGILLPVMFFTLFMGRRWNEEWRRAHLQGTRWSRFLESHEMPIAWTTVLVIAIVGSIAAFCFHWPAVSNP